MSASASSRGTQNDHGARLGFAPLSGRQGALLVSVTHVAQERPGDTIAVARKIAEETA